ncbi:MAG: response regulator [Bacteroidales bacterium]|nr:response regulator [Bacteroidales bacterium]MBN2755957.1 response regulator [Bacteroidales bacterium]
MESNFENKIIIVAEDADMNFILMKKILEQTKATIIRAVDGEDLLKIVENQKNVNLILMDMSMPKLDGFEATKRLRQKGCEIPIIAQTALMMNYDKEQAIEAGCNDFIQKPIIKDNLFRVLAKYL